MMIWMKGISFRLYRLDKLVGINGSQYKTVLYLNGVEKDVRKHGSEVLLRYLRDKYYGCPTGAGLDRCGTRSVIQLKRNSTT